MSNGNTYFNRFNTPIVFKHLFDISSVFFLQFRLVSKVNPRKFYSSTLSIYTSSILSVRACLLGIWKTIYLVLLLFNNNLLIFSHSLILQSSSFIMVSVLLLSSVVSLREFKEVDNVVSSAYITILNN